MGLLYNNVSDGFGEGLAERVATDLSLERGVLAACTMHLKLLVAKMSRR